MSHHAEKMIADAIRALVERRPSLAEEVIKSDDTLDQLELEIDNLCYQILALEQPVARDLRFIATALKIVRDIERIGDIAVNIAERAAELIQEPELKRLIDLPIMAEAAQRILKDSLDAFVNSDAELAEKVIRDDEFIDDCYEQIFRELLTYMMEDTKLHLARAETDLYRQAPRTRWRSLGEHRGNGDFPGQGAGHPAWNAS